MKSRNTFVRFLIIKVEACDIDVFLANCCKEQNCFFVLFDISYENVTVRKFNIYEILRTTERSTIVTMKIVLNYFQFLSFIFLYFNGQL